MAASDGRRVNRPYRKASEYLTNKQATYNGPRTINALENENAELRDKLTTSVRRLENMEVEFEQSREYFATQLDITTDKLNRTTQALKMLQGSYSELQAINYELEQRVLKVAHLENEKSQLTSDIHDLTNKLTETRSYLHKAHKENERLRKDCNLAVQLLECNAGNFKQQKAKELPRPLQQRVEEFQMDLSQYNEYINPYAADSDGEMDAPHPSMGGYRDVNDTIPTELLAKVLQKPENVHMNIEDTDYIRDPELNSTYKGKIADKKLVKYDYESPESPPHQTHTKSATVPRSSNKNNNQQGRFKDESQMPRSSSGVESSSPWELAPTAPSSGAESGASPWEMSAEVLRQDDDDTDYGAASAYGAFPVSYRRPKPKGTASRKKASTPPSAPEMGSPQKKPSSYSKSKMSTSYHKATSPKPQKGTGENQDVYISQTYQQRHDANTSAKAESDGSNTSRKTTPAKVPVDVERGTNAEKSSLLDRECSDDEDMVMTIEMGGREPSKVMMGSPKKDYGGGKAGAEFRGLLHEEDSDRDVSVRELDEVDNVKEYDEGEEDGMGEYQEEMNLRESVKHDIPEFDLLNLDDTAVVIGSNQNSPVHQIMMQQTLLLQDLESPVTDLAGASLLPDIPPPSGFSELIMDGSLPAPPPPDMFGGGDQANVRHPSNVTQSQPAGVTMDSTQSGIVPSQSPTKSPMDDLKALVDRELKSPQKKPLTSEHPDKQPTHSNAHPSTTIESPLDIEPVPHDCDGDATSERTSDLKETPPEDHEMPPSGRPGTDENDATAVVNGNVLRKTSEGVPGDEDEENVDPQEKIQATPSELVQDENLEEQCDDIPTQNSKSATPGDDTGCVEDRPVENSVHDLKSCGDAPAIETAAQNPKNMPVGCDAESNGEYNSIQTPALNHESVPASGDATSNSENGLDVLPDQKLESAAPGGSSALSPSNSYEPPTQNLESLTPSGSTASYGDSGHTGPSTQNLESMTPSGSTAPYDGDDITTDDTGSPSNYVGEEEKGGAQGLDHEPLEVLTLQEEPRGGNYNRRRRNSFERAKEFGSIMDD